MDSGCVSIGGASLGDETCGFLTGNRGDEERISTSRIGKSTCGWHGGGVSVLQREIDISLDKYKRIKATTNREKAYKQTTIQS